MLHVPFSLLSKEKLDGSALKQIRDKYLVNKQLCELLRDQQFANPGEILKIEGVLNHPDPVSVYKLIVPPFHDQPDYCIADNVISSEQLFIKSTEIAVHLWKLKDNLFRISFSSIDGEIFSIGLNDEFEIDPTTTKAGGYWFWEWPKLPVEVRRTLFSRLTTPQLIEELEDLGKMDEAAQPTFNTRTLPLKKVAQLVTFFYSTTGGYRISFGHGDGSVTSGTTGAPDGPIYDGGRPMDHNDYPQSNYCTLSPDWPFGDCCVAHDYCYIEGERARGCDECARFKCDLDFLKCMLTIAGANPALQQMAFVYFNAVRGFGEFAFEYCDRSVASTIVTGAIVGGTVVGGVIGGLGGGLVVGLTAGIATTAGTLIAMGYLHCGMCELVENLVERCEEDRKVREERCRRKKKKCKKKKKWWKKLWCKIEYFFTCVILEYIIRGACWLVKQGYRLAC